MTALLSSRWPCFCSRLIFTLSTTGKTAAIAASSQSLTLCGSQGTLERICESARALREQREKKELGCACRWVAAPFVALTDEDAAAENMQEPQFRRGTACKRIRSHEHTIRPRCSKETPRTFKGHVRHKHEHRGIAPVPTIHSPYA